jgi:hypothetical protein
MLSWFYHAMLELSINAARARKNGARFLRGDFRSARARRQRV